MRFGRPFDRFGVTAAQRNRDWYAMRVAGLEHQAVALLQTIDRERQATQPVAGHRVHAGLIKNDLGSKYKHARQPLFDGGQVLGIAYAIRQVDIDAALLFPKWKIVAAVDG